MVNTRLEDTCLWKVSGSNPSLIPDVSVVFFLSPNFMNVVHSCMEDPSVHGLLSIALDIPSMSLSTCNSLLKFGNQIML